MIKSMTGYGRGESSDEQRSFKAELKTVNHRYCDITVKLPRTIAFLEDRVRKAVSGEIQRGKADVYINYESRSLDSVRINLNEGLAMEYSRALKRLKEDFMLEGGDMLGLAAKFPELITVEKEAEDEEALWRLLHPALGDALAGLNNMRVLEGEAMRNDILKKADIIEGYVAEITSLAPNAELAYAQRLKRRINELLESAEIDQTRIVAETAIYAEKNSIDEEITRLKSHIAQLRTILDAGGAVGRKLDFLVQEMNREANTIASKTGDMDITSLTIEIKSEIEKIREQVQNIE